MAANGIKRQWSCGKSDSGNLGCDYLLLPVASKLQCASVLPLQTIHNMSFLLCFVFVYSLMVYFRNRSVFLCVLSQCLESKLALSSRAGLYLLRSIFWQWVGTINAEQSTCLRRVEKKMEQRQSSEEWSAVN